MRGTIDKPTWLGAMGRVVHRVQYAYTYALPKIRQVYIPFAHCQCLCNEVLAVSNRVLAPSVLPMVGGLAFLALQHATDWMLDRLPMVPTWTLEAVVASAKAIKKRRYQTALETLAVRPLSRKDAKIKGFTKREKIDPLAKVNPDPRMIMYRSPRFTLSFLTYVHPLEQMLFNQRGDGVDSPYGLLFAKFSDGDKRAREIVNKYNFIHQRNGGCVVFNLDVSRYDMHLSREVQRATDMRLFDEKLYCKRRDYGFIRNVIWFFIDQLATKNGLRASGMFGRKSGEGNTSLGNSFAMLMALVAFMVTIVQAKWDQWTDFDDGDDCLLFIAPQLERLITDHIRAFFAELGLDLKLENRTTMIEKILFCQCQPVQVRPDEWRMIRNPFRVMSRGTTVLYGGADPKIRLSHCYSVGKCELALNNGVPVLQEYALALVRNGNGGRMLARADAEYEHRYVKLSESFERPVVWVARDSFYRAFDIDPEEQLQLEAQLIAWKFDPETLPTGDVSYDAGFQPLRN